MTKKLKDLINSLPALPPDEGDYKDFAGEKYDQIWEAWLDAGYIGDEFPMTCGWSCPRAFLRELDEAQQ